MSAPTVLHLEAWSDLECAGGVPLDDMADASDLEITESIVAEQLITFQVPRSSRSLTALDYDNVVAVRYSDGSSTEWRITQRNRTTNGNQQNVAITAVHPSRALLEMPLVSVVLPGGDTTYTFAEAVKTPSEHVTDILLPAIQAIAPWIDLGNVDPTLLVSVGYDHLTPSAWIQKIVDAVVSNHLPCEFYFRKVSNTGYVIDLVSLINASAPTATVDVGTDVSELVEDGDDTNRVSVMMGLGADNATMRRVALRVKTIVSGTVLELEDGNGGARPILVDNQLSPKVVDPSAVNCALVNPNTGVLNEITACTANPCHATIGSTTGYTVGDLVEVRLNTSGHFLDRLALPGVRVKFGTITDDTLRGDYNIVPNAYQNNYANSGGPADGWGFDGTTGGTADVIARATSPAPTYGAFCTQYTSHDGAPEVSHLTTCGLTTPPSPWVTVVSDFAVLAYKFRLYITALNLFPEFGIRITLERAGNPGVAIATFDTDASLAFNTWVECAGTILVATSDRYYLRFVGHLTGLPAVSGSTPSVFYVGEAQVTQTADNVDWLLGSQANRIWQVTNQHLGENLTTPVQYTAQQEPFVVLDGTRWAHMLVTIGGMANVTNRATGLTQTLRCLTKVTRPWNADQHSTLTLGFQQPLFTQQTAAAATRAA